MNQFSIKKIWTLHPKTLKVSKSYTNVICIMSYQTWNEKCEIEMIFGAEAERKVCKISIFGSSEDPKIMKGQLKNLHFHIWFIARFD